MCAPRIRRPHRPNAKMLYCGRVLREYDRVTGEANFRTKKTDGTIRLTGQCVQCARESNKAYYEADPQAGVDRANRWKAENRERVRRSQNARNRQKRREQPTTPEQRAVNAARMRKHYEANRERVQTRAAGRKAFARALAIANIPHEVLRPHVRAEVVRMGATTLARLVGVSDRQIHKILHENGAATIEIVDALSAHLDFTLDEATEWTKEWAMLSGEDWPVEYLPKARGFLERTTPPELRKRILAWREIDPKAGRVTRPTEQEDPCP